MNWKELLKSEIENAYRVTEGLLALVDEDNLDWKPSPKNNWMKVSQLLHHISNSCGYGIRGFVTGDWGLPEGIKAENLSPEEMLPPAEKLPTLNSVKEARELLAKDKKLALKMLAECSEEKLANMTARAPWDPTDMILGQRFLQMVAHLNSHKSQLFYYLKLQGKPVNTGHLWAM